MEEIRIELVNIEVTFLDKVILTIPRLAVHQFDRIGIVGNNGAGKSTLLKLMAGQVKADKGQVNRFADFAYFEQLAKPTDKQTDFALRGKMSLQQKVQVGQLSGGEQTRLKLAQLLSTYYEGMLIDEPTTHLDAAGIQFFIDELQHCYGALVLVSHDRHVLDALVTTIWEVADGCVTEYTGNYSNYVAQKELEHIQQLETHEQYVREKSRLLKAAAEKMTKAERIMQANNRLSKNEMRAKPGVYITKSRGTSQKGIHRAAKSIEQRIEQLDAVEAPKEMPTIRFHQTAALGLHNKFPIMADRLTLTAGDKTVLHEASFQFPLGQTIAITGTNGSGKTTLLRHIIKKGAGITLAQKAVIGYFGQMSYQFEQDETVLAFMNARSDYDASLIHTVLHAMNFRGNDLKKNIRTLSGGEAIRLQLCQLFLGHYNLLILDEPTNFLDVACLQALETFLAAYKGTVLLVSHDKTFVERVADCVYVLEHQKLTYSSVNQT